MKLTLFSLLAVVASALASAHSPQPRSHHAIALRNPAFSAANGTSLTARNLTGVEGAGALGKRAFTNAFFSYYAAGQGACGRRNSGSDFIVAINRFQYGSGYPGPQCFKKINISYKGRSTTATIVDECMGCPYGGLDLSEGLFIYLTGSTRAGIVYGTWSFIGEGGGGGDHPTSTPKPKPPPKTSTHTRPTTSKHPTPTPTHHSTSSSNHTSEESHTQPTSTDADTTTTSSSSSSAPTPTDIEPVVANLAGMLQAALGLTHLEEAAAIDTNAEAAA